MEKHQLTQTHHIAPLLQLFQPSHLDVQCGPGTV